MRALYYGGGGGGANRILLYGINIISLLGSPGKERKKKNYHVFARGLGAKRIILYYYNIAEATCKTRKKKKKNPDRGEAFTADRKLRIHKIPRTRGRVLLKAILLFDVRIIIVRGGRRYTFGFDAVSRKRNYYTNVFTRTSEFLVGGPRGRYATQ